MRVKILALVLLVQGCNGGGGGSAQCGPNPLTASLSDLNSETIYVNNCNVTYTNTNNGCSMSGTVPYVTSLSGDLAVTVKAYDEPSCGTLPDSFICNFTVVGSGRLDIVCDELGINDSFYK